MKVGHLSIKGLWQFRLGVLDEKRRLKSKGFNPAFVTFFGYVAARILLS
jgi:hypothetical protein